MTRLIAMIILLMCSSVASAQEPTLSEEDVKERTARISKTLRCVVCQNQSIYDSNAPLAKDMRKLVEQRVRAGDTDDEVRAYLREPYGDFILLKPPMNSRTIWLWLTPLILIGLATLWFLSRRSLNPTRIPHPAINETDRLRLDNAFKNLDDESDTL